MIDHLDKQTQPLPLEQKRGRGRPATGKALSNAERQRAYRERQKAQRNEMERELHNAEATLRCDLGYNDDRQEEIDAATTAMNEAIGARKFWEKEAEHHRKRADALEKKIWDVERELAQRNEKPSRLNEGMQKIIRDVHEIADAIEGSTWRIQRKARANGRWATLKGSYWNEAQAEDALADLPNKKGSWWRIVEVKSEVED